MPRKETQTLLVIIAALDIAALVFWIGIYSFSQNQISDTVTKESAIRVEIIKNDTNFLMKNDIKYGKDYENNIDSYIVGRDGSAALIKIIESMADTSNLKSEIKSINYEQAANLTSLGLEYVRISISTIGSWTNTDSFLKLLEKYPLKIEMKNISLDKVSSASAQNAQWSGDFDFTVIKFK